MTKLDIARVGGVHCVIAADGSPVPIRLGGKPVEAFLPGWRPRGACGSFAPWTVLDLVHETGREASWLLSGQMEHWPTPIGKLAAPEQARILEPAAAAIRAVHAGLLCAARPSAPSHLALFDGLNRGSITEIVGLATPAELAVARVIDLRRQTEAIEIDPGPGRSRRLRLRAAAESLGGNWQAAIQAALADGALSCPSPVDGRMLRSQDSLVLHEHRIAYRFVDPRHHLVFFVSTTHRLFEATDLYIPAINSVLTLHGDDPPSSTLVQEFLCHCIADAAALLAYLARPAHPAAVVCRGYPGLHMGHQLWNELTALDRLVRDSDPADLPQVIVPNADQGSEVFGPIDAIFPEFAGKVDRRLRHPQSLGAFVYEAGYCLLRALDERVTLELADRIRRTAEREAPLANDAALAERIRAHAIPCILFGLRVENRTATDPGRVIAESIEHLRHAIGRRDGIDGPAPLVVVIDGHNSRRHDDPTCLYDSFGQSPNEAPILTELQLVLQLHRRFENTSVTIVNLCGASVARSLFWGWRADFFVAFWGAGLAKYRWVCNRPGLVLSNRWNLQSRGDLDIYHAQRYQEGGTAMGFIGSEHVTDLPQAPVQFAPVNPVPHYSNFQLDPAGLCAALDAMIAAHLP